ncbi:S-layer protein SlpA [Clostridioides difficile]|nr:S-layer protein SlpA [Clostridioides difficile]KJF63729.1 ATP-binding protein [Clostridioides difficile]MCK3747268.1 S-layer protein SlpA [Clostridioides difficile]MCP8397138.1 S-layer protein SlpA [Clostridioides difficile]MCP8415992.1 S-layer protein SlpA [Clostridioides difficile]MCP8492927.1 S-layer protein SlpA [Clostridioides difficile]
MNKKNLAMAMAAVTVVGSAAPVFAQTNVGSKGYTVVQDKYEKLLKELKSGLTKETITEVSIYFDGEFITDVVPGVGAADKLETLTKNQLKGLGDGKKVEFVVTYKTDAGTPAPTLTANDIDGYKTELDARGTSEIVVPKASGSTPGIAKLNSDAIEAGDANLTLGDVASWDVTTENGKKVLTITPKDISTFKYGTIVASGATAANLDDIDMKSDAVLKISEGESKKVTIANSLKFDSVTKKISGLDVSSTSGSSANTDTTTIRVIKAVEKTIDVKSNSSTKAQDLAKQYVFKDDGTNDVDNLSYIADHVNDVAIKDSDGDLTVTLYPEGKRLSTLSSTATKPSDLGNEDSPAKIVLKASKIKDLEDYLDDLVTYNNSYSNVQAVAGSDRIETAIELSRKFYNSTDSKALYKDPVNSVVLVGSQAIVDGLVASPLAAEKDAPLLLSSKDKLDSSVRAEIKRVMDLNSSTGISNKKEIFIAGGVNSVSKAVENELKDMGLKVTRLSGDDRYETSLAIADEIDIDDKAYVVGGTGLADAMSIAPVASQLKNGEATPIVVVDGKADKLSKEAEDFLDDAQVDIIGGEKSVSAKMEDYIDDATGKSPERISGDDRQATNAEVIKEYFDKDSVTNYFLAKDGSTKEDQLVDALAAAAVAGNFGAKYDNDTVTGTPSPAPIVLATDNLSAEQHVAISKTVDGDGAKNLVQVGQGIADSVVKKLKELLDM